MQRWRFLLLLALSPVLLGAAESAKPWVPEVGQPLPDQKGLMRPYGDGQVNLRLQEGCFFLYFVDADGKLIEPLVTNATIRWEELRKKNYNGTIGLGKGSGPFLTSSRRMSPPFLYRLSLTFLDPANGKLLHDFGRVVFSQQP